MTRAQAARLAELHLDAMRANDRAWAADSRGAYMGRDVSGELDAARAAFTAYLESLVEDGK